MVFLEDYFIKKIEFIFLFYYLAFTINLIKLIMSLYTSGQSLFERFKQVNKYRNTDNFPLGEPYSATIKWDGTQIWTRWRLDQDHNLWLVFLKTHKGNIIQDQEKYPDGFSSLQEFQESQTQFHQCSLFETLGTSQVWDGVKALFQHTNGVRELNLYLEHTLPGQSPCKIIYPDQKRNRPYFFEAVWFEENPNSEEGEPIKRTVSHTNQTKTEFWGDLPMVDLIQEGDVFDSQALRLLLDWLNQHPNHEGLMLQTGDKITKCKLHHAKELRPELDFIGIGFSEYQELLEIYEEFLSKSKIAIVRNEAEIKKSNKIPWEIIREEIEKEWGHIVTGDLLLQIQPYLGTSKENQTQFSMIIGQSSFKTNLFRSLDQQIGQQETKRHKKKIILELEKFVRSRLSCENSNL